MGLTIQEKAATLATFRAIHAHLMDILARWVPATPETDVKLLLGEHIWDTAQHADALGKRVYELRKPLQCSLCPADAYMRVLVTLSALQSTAARLHGFYDVVLPRLGLRYRTYLAATDSLLDAPTVRICERFLADAVRMSEAAHALRDALPQAHMADEPALQRLADLEAMAENVVCQPRGAPPTTAAVTFAANPVETIVVRDMTLRRDPAREACFTVVYTTTEMHEYAGMSPISRRERLHRHMHNEIGSLEIAAQCLADFPAAPWDLRMQLARQCWDETRHVRLLDRRLQELGGYKGEFPVANLEWTVTCMLDSLPARLAVQNRTFEAGQMDLLGDLVKRWREGGDDTTAAMLEGILADEIQHVRFANQWIKRMAQEDRRVLLHIAQAMRFLARVTDALAAKPGEVNAVGTVILDPTQHPRHVNIEDRQHADFSLEEIHAILRQAGFPSLVRQDEAVEVTV